MATLQDLVQAVTTLLAVPGMPAVLQLNSQTRERAFEAYVFSLMILGVKRAGGTVQLVGITSGANPATLVFRGAPGQMSSTAQDFVYARCVLGERTFELHVDVQYQGTSRATHEIDVSLYEGEGAEAIRESHAVPGTRQLHGAIECKFYDSSLGTALGRSFVGLLADCGAVKFASFVTNGQSMGLARYFTNKAPSPFWELSPLHPQVVERFVAEVEQTLRKWLAIT